MILHNEYLTEEELEILAKILQENIDTIMTTPGRETKKRSSHRRRKNIFSILFRGRPIGKLSFLK